ncbi:bifunctional DNA primase/polymerase [Kitasatospora sp. NPDC048540]|uniref:bifunctional DNA primase/polymerase n=1 Tax=unclassified Kitasatospora TaxID=2633591 RepID=UPI0009E6CBC4|nr:bifunctional DNA primase/polymerase [Kitasatospora sp. MBT63]
MDVRATTAELRLDDVRPPRTLAIALWCAAQGWPVHPLTPRYKTPAANCGECQAPGHTATGCPCLPAGRWCHGLLCATTDPDRLAQWWTKNPSFGVAVACGPAGLLVIDVDAHTTTVPERSRLLPGIPIADHINLDGLSTGHHTMGLLAALRSATDPCHDETTLRVRTPSGGLHIWYRTQPWQAFRSSTGSGKRRALAWQVDVRSGGGYIVAPGTVTSAGRYSPVGTARMPAPLPDWLAQELVRTGHLETSEVPVSGRTVPPRARQAVIAAGGGGNAATRTLASLLTEITDCAVIPEGAGFTEKLNRVAYTAGGLAAAGYLTLIEAERLLLDAARQARPEQERRCSSIIRSAMAAGSRRPLHLEGRS